MKRKILFFFFNDTATTEIYTLSLHDALPIFSMLVAMAQPTLASANTVRPKYSGGLRPTDRKSTRLNSSHGYISYAVFCLKKKKNRRHASITKYETTSSVRSTSRSRLYCNHLM